MMNKEKGNALLEAIVAMAVILIVVSSIATVITLGVNNSTFVKNQNLANKHSQDGLEKILTIHKRNTTIPVESGSGTNSLNISELGGTYCFGEDDVLYTESPCDPNIDGIFVREATFAQGKCGEDESFVGGTEISIDVSWVSGRCPENDRFCHAAKLASCIARDGTTVEL